MPSANILTEKPGEMDYINHPMKPAIKIVEHKIRNLEKRKLKLDDYKAKQDSGKELNADQLVAVAKYSEVTQQLELARDLMKQLCQANDETKRDIKKHRKAELAERVTHETEKFRNLFIFQMVIKDLENYDFSGENCDNSDLKNTVQLVKNHAFLCFSELLKEYDSCFELTAAIFAENWMQILDGSKKAIPSDSESGKDRRTTFKNIKDSLLAIAKSDYFTCKKRTAPEIFEEEKVNEDTITSDTESIPSSSANANSSIPQTILIEPAVIPVPVAPAVCQIQDSTYSFLQDSQIDLESPHFDPAIVAVSSCLPPGPSNSHVDNRQESNMYTTSNAAPQQLAIAMSNGVGDRVVPDFANKTLVPLIPESITEWNPNNPRNEQQETNSEERNGSDENGGTIRRVLLPVRTPAGPKVYEVTLKVPYGKTLVPYCHIVRRSTVVNDNDGPIRINYNNQFGGIANNRGGRGGRGSRRGDSNGFAPRGSRGRGGFSGGPGPGNNRSMGYFRSDQQEFGFDNREFRSGGFNRRGSGYGAGDRSGNGYGAGDRSGNGYSAGGNGFNATERGGSGYNGGDRGRGSGTSSGYRGRTSQGGNQGGNGNYMGGGYRGAVRGNNRSPRTTSENSNSVKCY